MPELERTPKPGFEIGKDGTSLLIVGFDGSEPSHNALAYAAGMARRDGARLMISFVRPLAETLAYSGTCVPPPTDEDDKTLRAEAARTLDGLNVPWTCVFGQGDAVCELSRLAARHHADAIVVGRSKSRLHLLGGSVSGRLARHAVCPVIIVP